jgi:hypothetical protein
VDIKWCTTLKSALSQIQGLIAQYGEDAEINPYSPDYTDSEYLGVYIMRPETDEEMAARIANEEIWDAIDGKSVIDRSLNASRLNLGLDNPGKPAIVPISTHQE